VTAYQNGTLTEEPESLVQLVVGQGPVEPDHDGTKKPVMWEGMRTGLSVLASNPTEYIVVRI
jgi:hypothetical protein